MQKVSILGATGSIGRSTLDVMSRNTDRYEVFALTTHKRVDDLIALTLEHRPRFVVTATKLDADRVRETLTGLSLQTEVLFGAEALADIAAHPDVDVVMASIVGAAGLLPTLAAVKAGKKVLLANKESLVMCGELFIDAVNANQATLLPVDSEHNAIFQSMPADFRYGDLAGSGISKLLLTGSGGPFRTTPLPELAMKTPDQACAHPNWDMGRKISVDSATMMNKGLEFIEARWLFGVQPDDIQVVLHPQSVIHSMVQYTDGSVLAQMGNPDMRTPIAHCLAYPERIDAGVAPLDFTALQAFTFDQPDPARYPNLFLAMQACRAGQYATTALNAANEIAVDAFLNQRIAFTDIARINQTTLDTVEPQALGDIESCIALDESARQIAMAQVAEVAV